MSIELTLKTIVKNPILHCRWLETLSYLENCGARKIVNHLPLESMTLEILKHAAEETRHAYFFKKQIEKISCLDKLNCYSRLGGIPGKNYLNLLDIQIAKYIKKRVTSNDFKNACYLLTTYAIEVRAEKLYTLYDKILIQNSSKIRLSSVLNEELGHLREMTEEIKHKKLSVFIPQCLNFEQVLFESFLGNIERELG